MIDVELICENPERVKESMWKRGLDIDLDRICSLDDSRRKLQQEIDDLKHQRNELSSAQERPDETTIQQGKELRDQIKQAEQELDKTTEDLQALAKPLPNLVADDVPAGGPEETVVVKAVPESPPRPSFQQRDYLTLAASSIDTERAATVSGSRFAYIKGPLAQLEIALVAYLFDTLQSQGFIPIIPPVLIGEQAMDGMGYLGQHSDEVYKTQDDLYLVGTSEQSIGPMHANETLSARDMPLRYVAFSSCFRREAGSHGKDVKGILRLHQFEKVEMFSLTAPEESGKEHEFLVSLQQSIMNALELPYRVVLLAAGDLGAPAAKTYDIETWIPSEQRYRETHSASNTTDYQARRLNIRVKTERGTAKVHMLNATAAALGRILIALIENHQQPDGSIAVPAVLHTYLPFTAIPPQEKNHS